MTASAPILKPLAAHVTTYPVPVTPEELYLDLMKKVLTRAIVAAGTYRRTLMPSKRLLQRGLRLFHRYALPRGYEIVRISQAQAEDYLESGHGALNRMEDSETMLGTRQLDNMQACMTTVITEGIPGDVVEAGVWRGGMTIFMRAVLKAYGVTDRDVWVADSFEGLPDVDKQVDKFEWNRGDMAVPHDHVRANFARYGLLDSQVRFVKGFFSESLPHAGIEKLAILRVDADLYTSTMDVLNELYPKLSVGGYAIFDDYFNLPDCRRAIEEYRERHGVIEAIERIDERAVYWRKDH